MLDKSDIRRLKIVMKRILITIMLLVSVACYGQASYRAIVTATEKEVIPEGITVNPVDGKIYVSSIGLKKIIAIDSLGGHNDFIKTGEHGFLEGLGMKIDEKRQWLWAVSNQKQDKLYLSRIHAFDLKTHALKQYYELKDTAQHLFNDLVLFSNGKVYITDTFASSLYEVDPSKKQLNLFTHDVLLSRANGIACTQQNIYVATRDGLMQLDAKSKKVTPLTFVDGKKAAWLDGIVFYENKIIGIAEEGILEYQLNPSRDKIVDVHTIDDNRNPYFHEPTTAALHADRLYVIANSNLAAYNENGESVKGIADKLGAVVVLVYGLK